MLRKLDPIFAQQILNTNIYKIDTERGRQTGQFHDVNDYYDKLGINRPFATQREWLKEGGIPYAAILAWMPGANFANQMNVQTLAAPDESALEGWQEMP
ncbi:MAG: hypothetical protein F6J86_08105 [Symploca sp. SIO1B1]|nr:hypothetical protein [Symploca sp. SIO1B1]